MRSRFQTVLVLSANRHIMRSQPSYLNQENTLHKTVTVLTANVLVQASFRIHSPGMGAAEHAASFELYANGYYIMSTKASPPGT